MAGGSTDERRNNSWFWVVTVTDISWVAEAAPLCEDAHTEYARTTGALTMTKTEMGVLNHENQECYLVLSTCSVYCRLEPMRLNFSLSYWS